MVRTLQQPARELRSPVAACVADNIGTAAAAAAAVWQRRPAGGGRARLSAQSAAYECFMVWSGLGGVSATAGCRRPRG